jgi:Coenzyme PQQ synthesis protein D (PqqD)
MTISRDFYPVARKTDLVIQEVGDEVLIYDLSTNRASCLNRTAAFVWQNCNGENSIADITSALGCSAEAEVADQVVWLAIDELSRNNLLDKEVSANEGFGGMSRREVIKKIGRGSVVALPLVATLVAPSALHAQSCTAPDLPCITSAQCCTSCCKDVGGGIFQCKPGGGACLP